MEGRLWIEIKKSYSDCGSDGGGAGGFDGNQHSQGLAALWRGITGYPPISQSTASYTVDCCTSLCKRVPKAFDPQFFGEPAIPDLHDHRIADPLYRGLLYIVAQYFQQGFAQACSI